MFTEDSTGFAGDSTAQAPGVPRCRRGRLGRRAVGAAPVTGLSLGLRDTLGPAPAEPVIEIEGAGAPPPPGRVTLYFHPEVPEATLALVVPPPS